jgi:hypothetical protein
MTPRADLPRYMDYRVLFAICLGGLAMSSALGKDSPPQPNGNTAVLLGVATGKHIGPPVTVDIVRVNDDEYHVALHWAARKVWQVPAGDTQIKLFCSMTEKSGWTRSLRGEYKLFQAKLEGGHYYRLTCENFEPADEDLGTDPAGIPELASPAVQPRP